MRRHEQGADEGEGCSDGFAGGELFAEEEIGQDDDEDGRELVEDGSASGGEVFESGDPEEGGDERSEDGHGNHRAPGFGVLESEEELTADLLWSRDRDGDEHDEGRDEEAESGNPDDGLLGVNVPDHENTDGHNDVCSGGEGDANPEVALVFDFGRHGCSHEDARDDE